MHDHRSVALEAERDRCDGRRASFRWWPSRGNGAQDGRAPRGVIGTMAYGLLATAAVAGSLVAMPAAASAAGSARPGGPAPLVATGGKDVVADSYIVVLKGKPGTARAGTSRSAIGRASAKGVHVNRQYQHALNGFSATLTAAQLTSLRNDPDVDYVSANHKVHVNSADTPTASWGLDRIDQRTGQDNTYTYNATGTGVTAYVIDTGIRITHTQFGGRATGGFTAIDDGNGTDDCYGHGTHVAGTIGGSTYGVAKAVHLVAVRVLDCDGSGTYEEVIAGIDWVTANHSGPSVANMSLGGGADQALDDAVTNSISSGVTYGVAAGNGDEFGNPLNACGFSPARTPLAITVGASDEGDFGAWFTNYGTCVDLFAPGVDITSAWNTSDTATETISGTSMATPHVVGVAALYLQTHPTATPAAVASFITGQATTGVLTDIGSGSPNRLLYSRDGSFPKWAATAGAQAVSGDFNGDGKTDIAVTGAKGWGSIPVAFSAGDGTFTTSNQSVSGFPGWAASTGAKVVTGDFNGDGKTDIAVTGVKGWGSIPVAISNGDGTFTVTNNSVANFPGWAASTGAKVVAADITGDGKADIAVTGVKGWGSIPVAVSTGTGTFTVTNNSVPDFPGWAASTGAQAVAGDITGDGKADIALTGVKSWGSVPVAVSAGSGTFTVTNNSVSSFPGWAASTGVKALGGNFAGDGKSDIAITSAKGWGSIPVAVSTGNGTFTTTNNSVSGFPSWAASSGVKVVAGDFNGDGKTDIALTGVSGWATVPVAFSGGSGAFSVTNYTTG
jgi:subtilisin family serine protease